MAAIFGFGGSDRPDPTPAPPPPVNSGDQQAARDAAAAEERRKRLAGGRASTILTSPFGDETAAPTASKVLLGQ